MKKYTYILIFLCLTGCATQIDDVVDKESLTMKEIYSGRFNENKIDIKEELTKRNIADKDIDLTGYTRDSYNENLVLFKRLSNPILVGYVYPHLTKEKTPIPGYSIPFRMSPKDYYVMPGEDRNLTF